MNPELSARGAERIAVGGSLTGPVGKCRQTLSFTQQLYQCLAVAGLALASYFIISHFVLQSVEVVGVSMAPTLSDSQKYLLNRWIYLVRTPRRSDIVVIRDPADNGFSVKRIVAAAGDTIRLKDGGVY